MVQLFSTVDVDKADVIGLRDAFATLVAAEAGTMHPDVVKMMIPSDRRLVLLRLCDRLVDDTESMSIETCAALDMLPGNTFADGAARAKIIAQAKEADRA